MGISQNRGTPFTCNIDQIPFKRDPPQFPVYCAIWTRFPFKRDPQKRVPLLSKTPQILHLGRLVQDEGLGFRV